ncbi:MAG: LytTR family DNA-binding domain-containing protein [Bacteroidota bacterium]
MKIRCAIVDDEPFAVKGLQKYVDQISFLSLETTCRTALELSEYLQMHEVDLVFLDIQMPYLTGVEWVKSMKAPPKVVFTTAYAEYAIEGYELDVMDYLLKPISFDRFYKAAQKAHEYFYASEIEKPEYCFLKVERRLEKVLFSDILFLEAMQNYVKVYLTDRALLIHMPLKKMAELLPPADFLQVHKSFWVAKDHVSAIEGQQLFIGTYTVPIGRTLKEKVLQELFSDKG